MTRSPGFQPLTPSPSAAISPANSPPARAGLPERISAPRISSPRLVPAARTATRTWPAPGAGTGVSRSSNTAPLEPGTVNHALIVCAIARVSFVWIGLHADSRAAERLVDGGGRRLAGAGVDAAHDVDDDLGHGGRHAGLSALGDDVAVHLLDLRAPSLGHVLAHRRPPVAARPEGRRDLLVQLRVDVGTIGARPGLGGEGADLRHPEAEYEPHPRRLGAKANADGATRRHRHDLGGAEAGHGLHGI